MSRINWKPILKCWGFSTPCELLHWMYVDENLTISQINKYLGISSAFYYLISCHIPRRPAGPKEPHTVIPSNLELLIEEHGAANTSIHLGVHYSTVKRWQRILRESRNDNEMHL